MKKITKTLSTINTLVLSIVGYYTFFKIDGGEKIFENMDWKALIIAVFLGGFCLWAHFSIVWIVKAETKGLVKEIEDRYKAYTDSFSSWFIYTSAISRIVQEKITNKMTEDELAKILYEGKFIADDLVRFGFSESVSNKIKTMYHEDELKRLKDEPNRNIEQLPDGA
jgi:hypothetical protein